MDGLRQFYESLVLSSVNWELLLRSLLLMFSAFFLLSFLSHYFCFQSRSELRYPARRRGGLPQDLFMTREELRVLLDPSETAADRSTIDRRRIRRIIRFADTTVGEAMIPLAEVVGFNEMRNTKEAVRTVLQYGYNRLPVYRGNITKCQRTADPEYLGFDEQRTGGGTDYRLYPPGSVPLSPPNYRPGFAVAAGQTRPYGYRGG